MSTCVCCKAVGDWTRHLDDHWAINWKTKLMELRGDDGIICDECFEKPSRFVEHGIRPRFTFKRSMHWRANEKRIAKLAPLKSKQP